MCRTICWALKREDSGSSRMRLFLLKRDSKELKPDMVVITSWAQHVRTPDGDSHTNQKSSPKLYNIKTHNGGIWLFLCIESIMSSFPTEGPPALLREDSEAHLSLTSDLTSQSPVGQTLRQGSREINGGEKAMRNKSYVQLRWNTCLLMRRQRAARLQRPRSPARFPLDRLCDSSRAQLWKDPGVWSAYLSYRETQTTPQKDVLGRDGTCVRTDPSICV